MEGYSYFRDRDGTLCRSNGRYMVWDPRGEAWHAYFWKSTDVVEITEEEARALFGAAAVRVSAQPGL